MSSAPPNGSLPEKIPLAAILPLRPVPSPRSSPTGLLSDSANISRSKVPPAASAPRDWENRPTFRAAAPPDPVPNRAQRSARHPRYAPAIRNARSAAPSHAPHHQNPALFRRQSSQSANTGNRADPQDPAPPPALLSRALPVALRREKCSADDAYE